MHRLEQLATAAHYQANWFSMEMRASKSPAELHSLLATISAGLGSFQRVAKSDGGFRLVYSNGVIPSRIYLNNENRIVGLWYSNPESEGRNDSARARSFASAVAAIKALPGQIGLQVTRDHTVLAEHEPNRPLAVGSAFKLSILAALEKAYADGRFKPDTVVHLKDSDRAPPSGQMQDWPSDTPVTLATAAALMMSISDNTAADLLMRVLGRDRVQAEAPKRNRPYLNVRELFTLKANTALANDWLESSSPAERRRLLKRIDQHPRPSQGALVRAPSDHTPIEWFYTPSELCRLIQRVAHVPIAQINPGLPLQGWDRIAYKGGSEPGVLDMTYALKRGQHRYCVSVTWNGHQAALEKLIPSVTKLVNALGESTPAMHGQPKP